MNLSDLFLQPERLWMLAVVPVLILAYVLATRRRKRTGMRFTNTAVLGRVVRKQSQWRRHLAVALTLLSLAALTIAWSRPSGVDRVPRERATIVLVLDVNLMPRVKGGGSAIFFHLARPDFGPTAGCLAIGRRDMLRLLPRLSTETVIAFGG